MLALGFSVAVSNSKIKTKSSSLTRFSLTHLHFLVHWIAFILDAKIWEGNGKVYYELALAKSQCKNSMATLLVAVTSGVGSFMWVLVTFMATAMTWSARWPFTSWAFMWALWMLWSIWMAWVAATVTATARAAPARWFFVVPRWRWMIMVMIVLAAMVTRSRWWRWVFWTFARRIRIITMVISSATFQMLWINGWWTMLYATLANSWRRLYGIH